jgi:hypothetical protein
LFGKPCKVEVSKDLLNYEDTSSYSEASTGIDASMYLDERGQSTIGITAELRDIIPLNFSSRKASTK